MFADRVIKASALAMALALCWGLGRSPLAAQEGAEVGAELSIIRLQKARLRVEAAELELERARKASREQIISRAELERRELAYRIAQLELSEAVVLFGGGGRVTVVSAEKIGGAGGESSVEVWLRFIPSSLGPAVHGELSESFPTSNAVTVSLAVDGVLISDPYERTIAELGVGETKSVRFALLRDVDELSIVLRHGGREEVRRVRLTQGASGSPLTLRSEQPSQDGELGSEVAFSFRAERFSRDEQDYELVVTGLPVEIGYAFYNPENDVRLSRLSFPASSSARDLELRLYLPREPSPLVVMDQPIRFEMGCSAMESHQMRAVLGLELIPRGVGAFSIEIANLYRELTEGESVAIEARLENIGSRRIENLRIETELPLDWRAEVVPSFIERLDQEASVTLRLHIEPPASVAVGDYEVRIRAEATALGRPIRGDEKLVRLHLKPKLNLLGMATIGVLLIAVFGGLIVLGLYLAKR